MNPPRTTIAQWIELMVRVPPELEPIAVTSYELDVLRAQHGVKHGVKWVEKIIDRRIVEVPDWSALSADTTRR